MRPGGSGQPDAAWVASPGRIGWSRVATGRDPVTVVTGRSAEAMRDQSVSEDMLLALMDEATFDTTLGGPE